MKNNISQVTHRDNHGAIIKPAGESVGGSGSDRVNQRWWVGNSGVPRRKPPPLAPHHFLRALYAPPRTAHARACAPRTALRATHAMPALHLLNTPTTTPRAHLAYAQHHVFIARFILSAHATLRRAAAAYTATHMRVPLRCLARFACLHTRLATYTRAAHPFTLAAHTFPSKDV